MGFFNKLRKQLRKSIRTGEAPVMPRRGGFLGGMPQTKPLITDMRFRDRMPSVDDGRVYAGGSPGLYKPGGRFYNPEARLQMPQPIPRAEIDISALEPLPMGDMRFRDRMPQKFTGLSGLFRRLQEQLRNQQIPQPIPERMPDQATLDKFREVAGRPNPFVKSNAPSFNPTIFGQPIGNMDFSQMPQISPEERMAPPVMNQMQGQPRMMMSGGRDANMVDFLNSDPQQQIFGIETRIGILENQLEEAKANNDRQAYDMIVQQINDADAQRINIMNSMNPMNSRMMLGESGRTISNMDRDSLDDILSDLEKKN
jgi:hypothetical protein